MPAELTLIDGEKKRTWENVGGGLAIYVPTGIYYIRKSFRRYRIPNLFVSTGEKTIGKARAKAAELIDAHKAKYLNIEDPVAKRLGEGKKVSDVIEEILRSETPKKRTRTQENHELYLGELQREWGSRPIERVTLSGWEAWLQDFRRRKGRATFWDYSKYMNLILRYAYKRKYVSHLITVPNPDPKKETGTLISIQEIRAVFAVMNDTTKDQFILSYECCMRLREVLYLTWDRVNLETGKIILRPEDVKTGSKTGKGREFFMSPEALKRLKARSENWKGSPYVFPSPSDPTRPVDANSTAWKKAKADAKKILPTFPTQARWHDLRHSSITHMVDAGFPIAKISDFAGVSISTIQRVYLHLTAASTKEISQALSILE